MVRKKASEPSRKELKSEIDKLKREIETLETEIAELKKPNPNFRKPKKLNETDIEIMKLMREKGLSNNKIAQKFDVTEGTIRNYFKEIV